MVHLEHPLVTQAAFHHAPELDHRSDKYRVKSKTQTEPSWNRGGKARIPAEIFRRLRRRLRRSLRGAGPSRPRVSMGRFPRQQPVQGRTSIECGCNMLAKQVPQAQAVTRVRKRLDGGDT